MTARRGVTTLMLLLAGAALARAAAPVIWDHPAGVGVAPLERGMSDGVAVGENGALTLSAPQREIFPGPSKTALPVILWTSTLDASGSLYVGSGNAGEVYRIDRKGAASSHFDSGELGVRALAVGPAGELYVGTFPNGAVYRLRTNGTVEPWFDAEDRYIWSMIADSGGTLYVGTGERGIVYQVTPQRDDVILYNGDDAHITALALDRSGTLLAGTAPSGLLYRIGRGGISELVLDSGLSEVTSLAVSPEGSVYVAASGVDRIEPPRKPGEKSDLMIEVTPASDGGIMDESLDMPRKITIDLAELLPQRPEAVSGTAGRVYRLEAGRAPSLVWKSDHEKVHALALGRDGTLLFGTGGRGTGGRIYRLEKDGSATSVRQFVEPQVTSLLAAPDGRVYACTSNPGRVYAVDPGTAQAGTYLSSIHDAGRMARWGTISWDADLPPGTRMELTTRSGNRPTPDGTWTDWSPPYSLPAGSAIGSPSARYLQWRAEMSRLKTEATPVLRRVRVTSLPENRPPSISGLSVLPAGEAVRIPPPPREPGEERPGGEPSQDAPRQSPPEGARWVVWSATDPDGDPLHQTIWAGRVPEMSYRKLAEAVESSPWAMPQKDLEEGSYRLRVETSDGPANGPERALTDAETTDLFTVDRTPPKLAVRPATGPAAPPDRIVAEVSATDALSPIARAEWAAAETGSVPAGPWRPLFCGDGICDTASEIFRVDAPAPPAGSRIVVRAFDGAGNPATLDLPGSRGEK